MLRKLVFYAYALTALCAMLLIISCEKVDTIITPAVTMNETEQAEIEVDNEPEQFTILTFGDDVNENSIRPINDEKEWTGWRNITWEKILGKENPEDYNFDVNSYTEWIGFDSSHWIYAAARGKIEYDIENLNSSLFRFSVAYPQPCINHPDFATIEIIITEDDVETFRSGLIPKEGQSFEISINPDTEILQIDISPMGANTCDFYALVEPRLITTQSQVDPLSATEKEDKTSEPIEPNKELEPEPFVYVYRYINGVKQENLKWKSFNSLEGFLADEEYPRMLERARSFNERFCGKTSREQSREQYWRIYIKTTNEEAAIEITNYLLETYPDDIIRDTDVTIRLTTHNDPENWWITPLKPKCKI